MIKSVCMYVSIYLSIYIYISRVSLHTHQVCWDNLFLQEDGVQEHHPGQQSQIVLCPEEAQEDERVEEGEVVDNEGEEGEEDEEDKEKKGGGLSRRTRLPVYKKLLAIREADRFLEEGLKTGVEKKVMATFPEMFMGTKGRMKSGMLGRWMVQCDEQDWRKIPFEKMSNHDQQLKDLPDWIRLPMGLPPRSLDKFKSGTNIPGAVTRKIIEMIEKVTCGEGTRLTSGSVKVDSVKKQAEILLEAYNRAQQQAAAQHGIAMPEVKSTVSERWINRLLSHYGWKRNTPNTLGAYLEFDDERMVKSRKAWAFLRLLGWFWGHLHIYIYIYVQ